MPDARCTDADPFVGEECSPLLGREEAVPVLVDKLRLRLADLLFDFDDLR